MMRAALAIVTLVLACKIEPVLELSPHRDAPRELANVRTIPHREPVDEETELVEAELRKQLSLLTSGFLGGRRPGTEGAALTAAHLERAMHELGLDPAGVGGGWRQPVVVSIRATEAAHLRLPGATASDEAEMLRHGESIAMWRTEATGQWTQSLGLVDAGWGITAPDLAYDDYAGLDPAGKIVLVRDGVPADAHFDADAASDYGSLDYKLERARRVGAAGCLIATGKLRSDAGWQALLARHATPRFEGGKAAAPAPAIGLAGLLSAEAEASLRAWASADATGTRALEVDITTTERTISDPNIIGRIPGSRFPEQVVVVLAHWDAGGVEPVLVDGGGAIDNASGVAAMLATARKSVEWTRRGRAPLRSIVFVGTAADTLDFAGVRALLDDGPLRRSRIVALLELDALGVRTSGPVLAALGLADSGLGSDAKRLRPTIRSLPDGEGPHAGSAHALALHARIPAITLTHHDPAVDRPELLDAHGRLGELVDDTRFVFDLAWSWADTERVPDLADPTITPPTPN